jgi:hypothetical protein
MVAYWSVTNTAVLKVLEVEHGIEDTLKVQLNEDRPFTAIIHHDEEGEAYIFVLGAHWYLNECMKV